MVCVQVKTACAPGQTGSNGGKHEQDAPRLINSPHRHFQRRREKPWVLTCSAPRSLEVKGDRRRSGAGNTCSSSGSKTNSSPAARGTLGGRRKRWRSQSLQSGRHAPTPESPAVPFARCSALRADRGAGIGRQESTSCTRLAEAANSAAAPCACCSAPQIACRCTGLRHAGHPPAPCAGCAATSTHVSWCAPRRKKYTVDQAAAAPKRTAHPQAPAGGCAAPCGTC